MSQAFKHNICLIYGEKGKKWLEDLPSLIQQLAAQWHLEELTLCEDLTYNYLLKGSQEKRPIVLKIGIDLPALTQECKALQSFKGYGAVPILDVDLSKGALLLHQVIPGHTLSSLFPHQDLEALHIAYQCAALLHQAPIPDNHSFPLLKDWFRLIDKEWDLPASQLQLARTLKNHLLQNSTTQVLLHGDLHHGNILSDEEGWIVIDPKGVIGDPLYDMTGCLLREPFELFMQQPNVSDLLSYRIERMAELSEQPLNEIWAWTYVQTVMSICWSLEDGQDVTLKPEYLRILEAQQPS